MQYKSQTNSPSISSQLALKPTTHTNHFYNHVRHRPSIFHRQDGCFHEARFSEVDFGEDRRYRQGQVGLHGFYHAASEPEVDHPEGWRYSQRQPERGPGTYLNAFASL